MVRDWERVFAVGHHEATAAVQLEVDGPAIGEVNRNPPRGNVIRRFGSIAVHELVDGSEADKVYKIFAQNERKLCQEIVLKKSKCQS